MQLFYTGYEAISIEHVVREPHSQHRKHMEVAVMAQISSTDTFGSIIAWLFQPRAGSCQALCTDFSRDPLAHPALDAMSLAEIGDLPAAELRARERQ